MVSDTLIFALIAARYLHDQDAGDKLRQVITLVSRMRREAPPEPTSRRKIDLQTAAKRTRSALEALRKIDQRMLAEAIQRGIGFAPDGFPASQPDDMTTVKQQRPSWHEALSEASAMMARMETIQRGLSVIGDAAVITHGRPERPYPAVFAVEALASIWRATRGTRTTQSYKAGGFGAMCLDLLACPPVRFSPTTVRQSVREVLSRPKQDPRG